MTALHCRHTRDSRNRLAVAIVPFGGGWDNGLSPVLVPAFPRRQPQRLPVRLAFGRSPAEVVPSHRRLGHESTIPPAGPSRHTRSPCRTRSSLTGCGTPSTTCTTWSRSTHLDPPIFRCEIARQAR